jgi:glycosyltransferase involved in cell wall biosynthesis
MNVLLVNRRLGYQSTTTYTYELSRAILARGHRLKLCAMGGELRDWFGKGGVEVLPVKFNFFSFRRLMRYLEEFDPDLIHIQNLRSLPLGHRLSERLGRPHLVTVHHVPETDGLASELPHWLLTGAIAVNEDIRESLVNDHRIAKELIRVIPPGINLERFVPGEPRDFRDEGRVPVVGAIGRLDPLKGFDHFLESIRKVIDQGHEAMFVIVGEGEEERSLRQKARDLKIEKVVTFAPPMPDIIDLYRSFDIVVMPTLRGGVGLTALEAMAMAKPVVASAVGEMLNIVLDGKTGFLVPEGDPDAIADRIVRLIGDPRLAIELGAAGRIRVSEIYSLPPMIGATEAFYQEILDEVESLGDTSFRRPPRRGSSSSSR